MTKNLGFTCLSLALGTALLRADAQEPTAAISAGTPPPAAATNAPPASSGKIKFANPVYDFGKSKADEPVKYTYIFTNIGDAVLEVMNVQPSCGCTAAGEWTRKVEPGKTGTIPIQFNGHGSGPIVKTITVTSSDKSQPPVMLQIKGTLWKPIDVNPAFAILNVPPDATAPVSTVVRIVNNTDELITLSAPESSNKSFTATIKTNTPGKEFEMTISAVQPLSPGSVQGQITVKTSSTNMPSFGVTAMAQVQAAVTVMPPQVTLQAGPLAGKSTSAVTIQNNGSGTLKLTEPTVSMNAAAMKDVDVQIQELQPGRSYTATLTFPQGFEIAQGQHVEFTVKSSNPQMPVIKVPINQMPKPPVVQPTGGTSSVPAPRSAAVAIPPRTAAQ